MDPQHSPLQPISPTLPEIHNETVSNSENGIETVNEPQLQEPLAEPEPEKRKTRLTNIEKQSIVDKILLRAKKLPTGEYKAQKGILQEVAAEYNISTRTMTSIWSKAKQQMQEGVAINVNSKAQNAGRKRIEVDLSKIEDIPFHQRTSVRALAKAFGLSKSTVHRLIKKGMLRSHTNAIKPLLTDANKIARMHYCYKQLDPITLPSNPTFRDFYNTIHIDEKWFFMSKTTQRFYMGLQEEDPVRACKSKRFITKVMFLAVVARPIITEDGIVLWDGKIGIFPFTEVIAAQRKSKNRGRGVMETKPIHSVTKQVYKEMLLNKVIPAIKEKWPQFVPKNIVIQQDNAKPHIAPNDPDFLVYANSDGFQMELTNQPPNSPDLNILDLGFFRAIQSLKEQSAPKSVEDLLDAVNDAFDKLTAQTLNKVWLSYMYVMEEVMKVEGGNNYKIPHKNKDRLIREGELPVVVQISQQVFQDTETTLKHLGSITDEPEPDMEDELDQFINEDDEEDLYLQ